jgi:hypothetical protein
MSRYGGFRVGKSRILNQWEQRRSPSAATVEAPKSIEEFDYSTAQGIWNLQSTTQFPKVTIIQVPGLAGKFFNGSWRTTLASGNIGTLPLTVNNDSSNVTGTTGLPSGAHRYGVNIWPSITYTTLGESYGFIAIGYFNAPTTGTYTFFTSSDDTSGVWVGEIAAAATGRTSTNVVVNNGIGVTAGQSNTKRSGTISLTAGVSYPIRIVHEEATGGDNLTFSWSGPDISETTNLTQYFTTPTANGVPLGKFT